MKRPKLKSRSPPRPKSLAQNPSASISPPAFFLSLDVKWISLLLITLVLCVFYPSLRNGFVSLDDPMYVTANPHVQDGLTWAGIRWALTTPDTGIWQPLTWVSYMTDCQIFGLSAAGHHFSGLLLHALNTLLLFLTLQKLTGAKWRSAMVAALFAVHPLHVETVAWVADRKDALAGCFWLGTILAYSFYASAKQARRPARFRCFLTLGLYICGLMCKTTMVTLPLVLLLLDWWPLARFASAPTPFISIFRSLIFEKIPFLILGLAIGLIGIGTLQHVEGAPSFQTFPLSDRIQNSILSYGWYVVKTFWPVDLAGYYPFPRSFSIWAVGGSALLILAFSIIIFRVQPKRPYLLIGWFWYGLTLLPVIGLIQIGGHTRADRYSYVPLIGLFILLVWGIHDLSRHWRRCRNSGLFAIALITLAGCILVTHRQIGYWHDSETFFNRMLAVTQENELAQGNLGVELVRQGRLDEAFGHLQEAVRLMPDNGDAQDNLGSLLGKLGRFNEAIDHFQNAIKLKPNNADAYCDLADALTFEGHLDEAMTAYQAALKLKPEIPDVHEKLARLLVMASHNDDAIIQFREAIHLNPKLANAHCGLGILLLKQDHLEESIEELQISLLLNQTLAEAQSNLGVALCRVGRLDEGITHLQKAVNLDSKNADARANLEIALRLRGETPSQHSSK